MGCEYTFTNIFLWSKYYGTEFAIIEGNLVFQSGIEEKAFSYPLGGEDIKRSVDSMMALCKQENRPFSMYNLTVEMQAELEALYPGKFLFTPDRASFDYLYRSEDLIGLKGKKYHGKRNHINKFTTKNNWSYESVSKENFADYLEMNEIWCEQNGCGQDEIKRAERCVVRNSFRYFDELGLRGGALRVDGKVIAFTLGEPINDQVFVVHIEKAFSQVQGAYPMINREFVTHEAGEYEYINREEDLGIEGLRKAKLSYNPAILLEKYNLTMKE